MRLTAARTLFVLAALVVPQFIQGGRVLFLPAVNLWRWGNEAVKGYGGHNFTVNNPDFLWNFLLLLAVPIGFALWFKVGDMLRSDCNAVQKRSRYIINFLIPAFSWIAMVVVITYSINHGGPLGASQWFRFGTTSDLAHSIYLTATGLLTIEYLTYMISRGKS